MRAALFYARPGMQIDVAQLVYNQATNESIRDALDILYLGAKNPLSKKYAGGAKGDGVTDDYAALSACFADASSPIVFIPPKAFFTSSTIAVPSGTKVISRGGKIQGNGTVGIFSLSYPSVGTTFDGLTIDGGKGSGTADIVTLIYAAGSTATPNNKSRNLCVKNCDLRNGSAGIAFENAENCDVFGNHINAMYRHTTGAYAGSYGYGVVMNGCFNSAVHDNFIGLETPVERHGVYLPVFRDADVNPTVLNFATNMRIDGNTINVKYDPANEPYSSCVESWNYFDVVISNNILLGGVRGINSAPDYQNGTRVKITNNKILGSEIGIRNGRTDKGATPDAYYFEHYDIEDNEIIPVNVANHQGVFLQGVKSIQARGNYIKGGGSNTFAFGYFDTQYNNIVCDLIQTDNMIEGFAQGYYLANVTKFVDKSSFKSFTGAVQPYSRVANIGSSEMSPTVSPVTQLYQFSGVDWAGVTYFDTALSKRITYNGSFWADEKGIRVRGSTAQRPSNISSAGGAASGRYAGLEYGFKYYDESAGAMLYWNTVAWDVAQQPAPPLGDTTANLNAFKAAYPAALSYGATSWNTTTGKPVYFNALSNNWVYSDGTAI